MAPTADEKSAGKKKPAGKKKTSPAGKKKTASAGKNPRAKKSFPPLNDGGSSRYKKKTSKQNDDDNRILILEALKEKHPDVQISSRSLSSMCDAVNEIREKFLQEASRISKDGSRENITRSEIAAAAYLLLPYEFAKRVISGADKDFAKVTSS